MAARILLFFEHYLSAFVFPPLKLGEVEPLPGLEISQLQQDGLVMRPLNLQLEEDRFGVLMVLSGFRCRSLLVLDFQLHLQVTSDVALLHECHHHMGEVVLELGLVYPEAGLAVSAEVGLEDCQLSGLFALFPVLDDVRATHQ